MIIMNSDSDSPHEMPAMHGNLSHTLLTCRQATGQQTKRQKVSDGLPPGW